MSKKMMHDFIGAVGLLALVGHTVMEYTSFGEEYRQERDAKQEEIVEKLTSDIRSGNLLVCDARDTFNGTKPHRYYFQVAEGTNFEALIKDPDIGYFAEEKVVLTAVDIAENEGTMKTATVSLYSEDPSKVLGGCNGLKLNWMSTRYGYGDSNPTHPIVVEPFGLGHMYSSEQVTALKVKVLSPTSI